MKTPALSIVAALLLAGTAQAQTGMVQPIRPSSTEALNRHLSRLASNPRDIEALIGAGEAAIDLDDTRAAAGFFARADTLQPNNSRVKAGLGRVMLKTQNPAEALKLFDQATRLGYSEAALLSDRGLARDLTGDQAGAQRDYQAALKRTPDNSELIYRYAASLGISGQVEAADKVLQPLLYKSDRPAWRFRAFILAMNNRQDDARKIASQTMPGQLAAALTPYMQKMPYLTPAQKAAAVHFGHFPARVGTTIAAVTPTPAPAAAVPAQPAAPAAVATPARQAAQPRSSTGRSTLARAESRRAAPAPVPAPAPASAAQTRTATATATTPVEVPVQTQPAPQPATPPAQPRPATPATPPAQPRSAQVQGPPAPGFESLPSQPPASPAGAQPTRLAAATQAQTPAPAAAPQPSPQQAAPAQPAASAAATPAPPQPNPEATRTLADIIRSIDVPESERQPAVAAVDLNEIAALQAARRAEREAAAEQAKKAAAAEKAKAAAAAKAKAEADAKAKKAAEEKARLAANPSRNWVQIGTGSDRGALAFTLKNLRRKYDDVAPQDGWVASWGRTNRLLIGPFASFARAKAVESKLKTAGADAFAWQSDAGEVVERLGSK